MESKKKRVTKSRINAIHNAVAFIQNMDSFSGVSDKEVKDHHIIGDLLTQNAKEVVKFLLTKPVNTKAR